MSICGRGASRLEEFAHDTTGLLALFLLVIFILFALAPAPAAAQAYPPNGSDVPVIAPASEPPAPMTPPPPKPWDQQSQWNMDLVGYSDLQGRGAYQPIIINQNGREIAYIGHHGGTRMNPLTGKDEPNGTSIIDVTDPRNPQYLAHIPGDPIAPGAPAEAGGAQMNRVCSGDVLPHAEKGKWYLLRTFGNQAIQLYDVTDPSHPGFLTNVVDHLSNTHKNWWECDTGIAYLVANNPAEGWKHTRNQQHMKIYDLSNPNKPVYIRDFALNGSQPNATSFEGPVNPPPGLHGGISVGPKRNRLYLAYGVSFNGVIQILDRQKLLTDFHNPLNPSAEEMLAPQVGYIDMSQDEGGHSAFPVLGVKLPEFRGYQKGDTRDLLIVVSEATANECTVQVPHLAYLVDITNEKTPWPISTLRVPENPGDFCHKGARFGAHSVAESFYPPYYGKLAVLAWFNAGVRVWDIRDPYEPRPVAYFIPASNQNTMETCANLPNGSKDCKKAIMTNNVELDDRGYIYAVDRVGSGMDILQLTGAARQVVGGN